MTKIKISDVAKMLGSSEQCIRVGLQRGKFPFGSAYKTKEENKKYMYSIYPGKLAEYVGQDRFDKVMKNKEATC